MKTPRNNTTSVGEAIGSEEVVMPVKENVAHNRSQGEEGSSEQRPPRPWRTEGLPQGQPPNRRPGWSEIVTLVLSYALFFGLLTVQDLSLIHI